MPLSSRVSRFSVVEAERRRIEQRQFVRVQGRDSAGRIGCLTDVGHQAGRGVRAAVGGEDEEGVLKGWCATGRET